MAVPGGEGDRGRLAGVHAAFFGPRPWAWPVLERYAARIRERPSVKAALAIELPLFQREQAATQAAATSGRHTSES
jgi:hypothetical protein